MPRVRVARDRGGVAGLGRVLREGALVPHVFFGVGVGLPIVLSGIPDSRDGPVSQIVAFACVAGGINGVVSSLLLPVVTAKAHSSRAWSCEGQPGLIRIVLVCWMAIVGGSIVLTMVALVGGFGVASFAGWSD